jgi:hypothetical protein
MLSNTLRIAARTTRANARSYGSGGRPSQASLDAMAEKNGALFKRETAIAMGFGIVLAFAWKFSVADPIRRDIDNYYAEYNKRNGL